jgi:hypothetical protein
MAKVIPSRMTAEVEGDCVIVQYWRSFAHLESYARDHDKQHWPAWVDFNKRVGKAREDVGIWHETYQARAGEYETVYSGMPPFGLGKVGNLVPASGRRESARGRFVRAASAEPMSPSSLGAESTATPARMGG